MTLPRAATRQVGENTCTPATATSSPASRTPTYWPVSSIRGSNQFPGYATAYSSSSAGRSARPSTSPAGPTCASRAGSVNAIRWCAAASDTSYQRATVASRPGDRCAHSRAGNTGASSSNSVASSPARSGAANASNVGVATPWYSSATWSPRRYHDVYGQKKSSRSPSW
ncbi:hypothetical protein ACFY2R_17550 [Micromonospora olivasterospora]|uniref:Uncharacterized protein n=1 Tax=Micromonospora olivasterospora TaxID=1880 RepID=A0A562IHS7_MICOL|nr:hypothetical protein [Micromonospora olivasterospora]TWH70285.1 hypothetical protein JD77_05308 [Micromonospora olivasterospora]